MTGGGGLFGAGDGARPVVAAIVPARRDPSLVTVRVGRRIVATVETDDVRAAGAVVGEALSDEAIAALARADARVRALRDARRIVGRAAVARSRLVDRLIAKGHARDVAENAADRLERAGAIDERAVAEAVVHAARRAGPVGRSRLEATLRAKGVSEEAGSAVIADALGAGDPMAEAEAFARGKAARMARLDRATARRRLYGLLARRGFEAEVCEDVVRRVLGEEG